MSEGLVTVHASNSRDADGRMLPDPAAILAQLRTEFPHWGILRDCPTPGHWVGVLGNDLQVTGCSGLDLRERLLACAVR